MPPPKSNARVASGRAGPKSRKPAPAIVARKPTKQQSAKQKYSLPMYLKCLADPFSNPACRMPDMFGGKTIAWKLVDEYTVSSDASGAVLWAVSPSIARASYTYPITAGVVGAAAFAPHPDATAVSTGFAQTRLVCFGVEVVYTGAAQTASGWLSMVEENTPAYPEGLNIATLGDDGVSDRADKGRVVTTFPVQEPRFEGQLPAANLPTFPYVFFLAQGLPFSMPVFRVRVTRHMEGLPSRTNVMRDAAHLSKASPAVLAASVNMQDTPRTSVNEAGARSSVVTALESAAMYAITHPTETMGHVESAVAMVSALLL